MTFDNFLMDARSALTLISFLTFTGILLWAYSGRRREDFQRAAMLPFDDEDLSNDAVEENHG